MDNESSFIRSLKYKDHSSWALWGDSVNDMSIFALENEPWKKLNNKVVIVGLNASNPVENFNNFHFVDSMKSGRAFDYRLKMVLENTIFYGAYLTDLVVFDNDYNPNSKEVGVTNRHINDFLEEINDVCDNPIIIALGGSVDEALKKYKIKHFTIWHFSCYYNDKDYLEHNSEELKKIADEIFD